MAKVRVKMNSAGARELLSAPGVVADLRSRGERVLSAARAAAPVGETGGYLASLHLEVDQTDRAAVRVGADVDYAMVVEANHGVLVRALSGGA